MAPRDSSILTISINPDCFRISKWWRTVVSAFLWPIYFKAEVIWSADNVWWYSISTIFDRAGSSIARACPILVVTVRLTLICFSSRVDIQNYLSIWSKRSSYHIFLANRINFSLLLPASCRHHNHSTDTITIISHSMILIPLW